MRPLLLMLLIFRHKSFLPPSIPQKTFVLPAAVSGNSAIQRWYSGYCIYHHILGRYECPPLCTSAHIWKICITVGMASCGFPAVSGGNRRQHKLKDAVLHLILDITVIMYLMPVAGIDPGGNLMPGFAQPV